MVDLELEGDTEHWEQQRTDSEQQRAFELSGLEPGLVLEQPVLVVYSVLRPAAAVAFRELVID